MKPPRQLPLPFARPARSVTPGSGTADSARLARIESRLVQLMKHLGMTSDGRVHLPEDKPTEAKDDTDGHQATGPAQSPANP